MLLVTYFPKVLLFYNFLWNRKQLYVHVAMLISVLYIPLGRVSELNQLLDVDIDLVISQHLNENIYILQWLYFLFKHLAQNPFCSASFQSSVYSLFVINYIELDRLYLAKSMCTLNNLSYMWFFHKVWIIKSCV